jgi:hypothetical protein
MGQALQACKDLGQTPQQTTDSSQTTQGSKVARNIKATHISALSQRRINMGSIGRKEDSREHTAKSLRCARPSMAVQGQGERRARQSKSRKGSHSQGREEWNRSAPLKCYAASPNLSVNNAFQWNFQGSSWMDGRGNLGVHGCSSQIQFGPPHLIVVLTTRILWGLKGRMVLALSDKFLQRQKQECCLHLL